VAAQIFGAAAAAPAPAACTSRTTTGTSSLAAAATTPTSGGGEVAGGSRRSGDAVRLLRVGVAAFGSANLGGGGSLRTVALRGPVHAPWPARRSMERRATRMTCHALVRTGGAVFAGWDLD